MSLGLPLKFTLYAISDLCFNNVADKQLDTNKKIYQIFNKYYKVVPIYTACN